MAEPQDRPDSGRAATPPAKKAAAKKAPVKKAAAKKMPAKKAPAKKAPAKKAPAKKAPPPPHQAAPTVNATLPVREAVEPPPPQHTFGRGHKIPLSLALAAAGLVAIALSRFRHE